MFYVVSDGIPTEHRGWKLDTDHFCRKKVTPQNVKFTRGFYFAQNSIREIKLV